MTERLPLILWPLWQRLLLVVALVILLAGLVAWALSGA